MSNAEQLMAKDADWRTLEMIMPVWAKFEVL
jgi:hypothetical protein